jgi:proteasome accessory factor C
MTWRHLRGRKRKDQNIPAAKLLRVLEMIDLLRRQRKTVKQLAERFDISERTVYRYVNLLEAAGFPIDKDFNDKFFIAT